jgi:ribosomal-protein-alanine N-acetyltransferase
MEQQNSQVSILPAGLSDLNPLREMDRICFDKDQWPLLELISVLIYPGIVRLKADSDGKMVGFISGDTRQVEGVGWITTISVLPEYRRRGIARELILACEAVLAKPLVRLSVRRSNLGAQRVYVDLGYKYLEVWKGYYSDGEDGLVMEKNYLKIG